MAKVTVEKGIYERKGNPKSLEETKTRSMGRYSFTRRQLSCCTFIKWEHQHKGKPPRKLSSHQPPSKIPPFGSRLYSHRSVKLSHQSRFAGQKDLTIRQIRNF